MKMYLFFVVTALCVARRSRGLQPQPQPQPEPVLVLYTLLVKMLATDVQPSSSNAPPHPSKQHKAVVYLFTVFFHYWHL